MSSPLGLFFSFCALGIFTCVFFVFSMSETIEFELVRPVNPAGVSFIKYLWGAIGARNRSLLEDRERRGELTRLIQKLGFALEEKVGGNKLVTGRVVLTLENGRPVRLALRDVKVWAETGALEGEVAVELK
ncbi:hypothetical protein Tpen_0054 [Thermofilum pendens Hrk 5]|uniref:DUF2258 domain-containing protein n=2 Tax=Thermofilum pendens TaxID=2269 RepID=A1RW84_THEPD|nr:hypothetical protein Tpen_0054 [Thermofilum pendens Hrk 5]